MSEVSQIDLIPPLADIEHPLTDTRSLTTQSSIHRTNSAAAGESADSTVILPSPIIVAASAVPSGSVPSKKTRDSVPRSSEEATNAIPQALHRESNSTAAHDNLQTSPASPDVDEHFGAMGVIYSIESHQESPSPAYYGQSSFASLLSQIPSDPARSRRLSHRLGQSSLRMACGPLFTGSAVSGPAKKCLWSPLPPRNVADNLLSQYWSNVHLFYPWIHTQSFQKAYEALWIPSQSTLATVDLPQVGLGGSDCSDIVFHVALNAIFALGCEGSDIAVGQLDHAASEFIDRATGMLNPDLLDDANLSLIQALLLIITYLQGTQKVKKTWSLVGSACALAQGLGLHLNYDDSKYTVLEIEMRRRAWHACVFYDNIASMTFGRFPFLLGAPKVPSFSTIDDEYLNEDSEGCCQPEGKFSRIAFAVANVKLGWIIGDILQRLYNNQGGGDVVLKSSSPKSQAAPTSIFDALAVLDSSLMDFESELPNQLRPKHYDGKEPSTQDDVHFLRQSYVLRARTIHARLMLYRPSFCRTCAHLQLKGACFDRKGRTCNNKVENIGFAFEFHCALACYHSSSEMIELLHNAIAKDHWGAWWYAIYYLATSTIVLILAATTANIRDEMDEGKFTMLWQMSLEALDTINRKHPMAGQCAAALQAIKRRALQSYQATTLTTRHADSNARPRSLGAVLTQHSQPTLHGQRNEAGNDWSFWNPTPEAFASLNEMEIGNTEDDIGGLTPLLENLQNSFGGGMVTGIFEHIPDMNLNNWFQC